jgi:hypothetical protein
VKPPPERAGARHADYRAEAARCRRLANGFWRTNNPTALRLLEMATEFDAKAIEAEAAAPISPA